MRTTITLEDDVARDLAEIQRTSGGGFKQTINDVLRAGLATLRRRRAHKPESFRTEPVSLGQPRLQNLDDISEVLAFAEGERHG
jgi:hypothetical protein